jgi:hypothetical protein
MLTLAESCWVMLSHAESCWVMLSHAESCWVMLSHAESCSVILSHAESFLPRFQPCRVYTYVVDILCYCAQPVLILHFCGKMYLATLGKDIKAYAPTPFLDATPSIVGVVDGLWFCFVCFHTFRVTDDCQCSGFAGSSFNISEYVHV